MVFSRIYIQECINLIRHKNRNIKQLLIALNSSPKQALDAMWEVVISAELCKLGYVELEKDFKEYGTNNSPDVFFTNKEIEFLADIKCISDQDKHDNNRVSELQLLIYQQFCKLGLESFSCHLDIKEAYSSERNNKNIDLKLPKDISGYFHTYIKNQLKKDQLHYKFYDLGNYEGLCFELNIKINNQFSTAHHASYTVSEVDRKTTLYNLLSKKYEQIKFYNGFKGFIICDGDYALFKQKNYSARQYSTFESVCCNYLQQKNKVGFIVGIWIENKKGIFDRGYNVKYQVYCCDRLKKQKLESLFAKILENLPEVIRTPTNTKKLLAVNKYGSGSIGFRADSNKKETTYGFSMREIHSVLAGYKVLSRNEEHNMFPYITSEKLVRIWIDQEVYKEDYYFNFKCMEKPTERVEETIEEDYDVLVPVQSFLDLMAGRIEFNYFDKKLIFNNKIKSNIFKNHYDNGYLIKSVVLIESNKIGFKFDTIKSPLISDFI